MEEKLQPIDTTKGREQRDKFREELEKKAEEEQEPKFDVGKIYSKNLSPKEIAEKISKLTDKELQMIIIPTSEKTADIIIRDIPK